MKKARIYSILSLALIFPMLVLAQRPTNSQERKVIEKALDNFEMYKSCITVADDETRSYFLDLFKNKSVPVYNDLLGISHKSDITVSNYLDEQKLNMVSPIIKICNVKRDRIWEDNGKWKIQLSFDKSLTFQNQCGINFNTLDFYGKMYRETMVLSYDDVNQVCRIEAITGKIDSDRVLPEDYCVLDSTSTKDTRVVYRHNDGISERVKFNNFGQMLLANGFEKNQFSYPDDDVVLKTNYNTECHLMTLSYANYHWRIKPYFNISIGKALSVGNEWAYSKVSSSSYSLGVDAGYVFPSKGKVKFGVFMGLGYSSSNLKLSYQSDKYHFNTNQDIDDDTYTRIYENLKLDQSTRISEFSIPIYADVDWRFSKLVSAYIDLGLKLNLNLSSTTGTFNGSAENVYGIYPQYDNLLLDYHWGYNGFTQNLSLTSESRCDGENMSVSKFAPDLLIGAGFRIKIPHTPMTIDLGLGYLKGLGDIISTSGGYNGNKYSSNIVYNEFAGDTTTEHAHDLIENAGSVSRSMLNFNIGLLLKF